MTIRYNLVRIMKKFFYPKNKTDELLTDKTTIHINKNQIDDFPSTVNPSSHTHGNMNNNGTINSDTNSVNKIVVTNGSNELKTINKIPAANVVHQSLDSKSDANHSHGIIQNNGTVTNPDGTPKNLAIQNNGKIIIEDKITRTSQLTNDGEGSHIFITEDDNRLTDSRNPTSHTHTKSQITDFPTSMTPTSHTHTKSQITDFPTSMAPTSHTHTKNQITDLFNYDISLSKYNLDLASSISNDKTCDVTVKVTDSNGAVISGHQVTIYKNGVSWKTGTTSSLGVFTASYTAETEGLMTFSVNTSKIHCHVNSSSQNQWKLIWSRNGYDFYINAHLRLVFFKYYRKDYTSFTSAKTITFMAENGTDGKETFKLYPPIKSGVVIPCYNNDLMGLLTTETDSEDDYYGQRVLQIRSRTAHDKVTINCTCMYPY